VPFQARRSQLLDLGQGLVDIVFAESALAGLGQGADFFLALGLADGQQAYTGNRAMGGAAGRFNPLPNPGQSFGRRFDCWET
jgi:hypothetical protein